jgi:outer membrane protein assembly factor BamB
VAGGVVYTTVPGTLEAFDASGNTNCSGAGAARTCAPLWTASINGAIENSPAIANGIVLVGGFGSGISGTGTLFAFDAAGVRGCGGSPKTCAPVWQADLACCEISAPAVVGNTVYATASDGALFAFDVNGGPNCTGTPRICQPLWGATLDLEARNSSIAVANGRVYVGEVGTFGEVQVFDAAGVQNCGPASGRIDCRPLWVAPLANAVNTSLVVVNDVLYLGTTDRKLYAFDATGNTNCSGTPKACGPIWTAPTGDLITFDAPAVAYGKLYVGTNDGLFTFDANGITNCGGTPKTCAPLSTTAGPVGLASPTVANGVVYLGSVDGNLYAKNACSVGSPGCTQMNFSIATGAAVGSPVVASGTVYVRSGTSIQAYRLP